MLRYLYTDIVFQEVPDEVSLAIAISGCQIRCKGCHSRELWEDKGTVLGLTELQWLINQSEGITCLLLMGGEHDIDGLIELFEYAHERNLKTAWYSGLDVVNRGDVRIYKHLDYIKLGHYDMELGGLKSPTTNQRLYKLSHSDELKKEDITFKLQKK